ncbi:hypothetical protein [Halorussus halophilus]|uniref:hypothetical protein n=1 Tax=Halorussus halophilus TaxID=2650975 RepID=UPI0013011FFB|nr:hypothetical protein [Halorussus halophilus]
MSGDTGSPGEDIRSSGPVEYFLGVPLVIALFIGAVVLYLRGSAIVHEHVPDLPLLVDVLALAVLVGVLLYAMFRTIDLVKQ